MNQLGPAYNKKLDGPRLSDQRETIRKYMLTHHWKTLAEIHAELGYPEASISAQMRHLRKSMFGSYRLDKRRRLMADGTASGVWEYRLTDPWWHGQEANGHVVFA